MQETRGRLTAFQGHPQCLDDEMAIVDGTDGPADEEPRVEVEDRRQVERTTAANDELGRVANPALVRRLGHKVLAKHIRRDGLIMVAHGRTFEAFPHARREPLRPHQPHHPFAADGDALFDQVLVHAGAPIPIATGLMRRADQHAELPVPLCVCRLGPPAPRVEPARRHVERPDRALAPCSAPSPCG